MDYNEILDNIFPFRMIIIHGTPVRATVTCNVLLELKQMSYIGGASNDLSNSAINKLISTSISNLICKISWFETLNLYELHRIVIEEYN